MLMEDEKEEISFLPRKAPPVAYDIGCPRENSGVIQMRSNTKICIY